MSPSRTSRRKPAGRRPGPDDKSGSNGDTGGEPVSVRHNAVTDHYEVGAVLDGHFIALHQVPGAQVRATIRNIDAGAGKPVDDPPDSAA